jgi:hypothetical protein
MQNMKRFASYNNVKKAILIEVAKTFDPKDIEHLQKQFVLMDVDNSGTITIEEMIRAMTSFRTGEGGEAVYDPQQVREVCHSLLPCCSDDCAESCSHFVNYQISQIGIDADSSIRAKIMQLWLQPHHSNVAWIAPNLFAFFACMHLYRHMNVFEDNSSKIVRC